MQIPNEPEKGQPITAEWARQIVRLLRALYPRPSPEVFPQVRPGGTTFKIRAQSPGRAASAPCNLKCTAGAVEEVNKIFVSWGTICGRQPTGFSASDTFSLTPAGDTGYVYAKGVANTDTLQWVSAAVIQSANPFLHNTTTIAYRMIGSWDTVDGALKVEPLCGNVDFDLCDLAAADIVP